MKWNGLEFIESFAFRPNNGHKTRHPTHWINRKVYRNKTIYETKPNKTTRIKKRSIKIDDDDDGDGGDEETEADEDG